MSYGIRDLLYKLGLMQLSVAGEVKAQDEVYESVNLRSQAHPVTEMGLRKGGSSVAGGGCCLWEASHSKQSLWASQEQRRA